MLVGLAAGFLAVPAIANAQSAIIYGSLGNFDISNDTGQVCHGFEVDIDGVTVGDVPYSFSAERYGAPQVLSTAAGVQVRWESPYDPTAQQFAERTLPHTVPWFPGQCYQWNPATYQNSGCEHFGTGATANPTHVSARWLCEDPSNPGTLVPNDPPTAVPMPTYYVQPPVQPNNPPVLVVEVQAPEPAESPDLYGDAQWMRVFKVELQRPIALNELLADNPAVVPMDPAQLESNWAIVQDEPAAGGNGNRRRKRNQGNIDPTTRAVVRRIEMYAFTGQYDPITHEALCADGLCNAPAADELGDLVSVQMTGVNVQPDALIVTKTGNGNVDSSDKLVSCGNKCAQPYDAGRVVSLTAKAGSGSTFLGWSGACAGIGNTCSVTVNGAVNVAAAFSAPSGGGGGGGGGGGSTAQFTLQVGRSNTGTVTATPAGVDRALNCGGTCSAKFAAGTAVTLTATPPAGKSFVGWGGACAGTATTCTLAMNANTSVQANFSK
jgi:NOL1/NOP2/fmu family ribosome biogenesis protein